MNPIFVFMLIVATGFVSAGFLNSVYQAATNKMMSFDLTSEKSFGLAFALLTLIFAGPYVIMRNAIKGYMLKDRHGAWVAASSAICVGWCFVSGAFLMNIYLTL